ncbi:MAG: TRAP transporter TatT component family protein [Wenzhouxiangellaceae bacterium]
MLAGCGALVERATSNFAADLEQAVLNYDEPLIIERGLPSFLLILEARARANPENADLLINLAGLTGTYASLFVDQPDSARRLTRRALDYAEQAVCARQSILCRASRLPFDSFEQRLEDLDEGHLESAYALATAWVSWIAAVSNDYAALADLPKVETLLEKVAAIDPQHDDGAVWLYLAVLNSQRPPAAGGRPDLAVEFYQRARRISKGRNLLIDVFMADQYARLVFDRELFVELLEGVVQADHEQPGYVLANRIAQARAQQLLDQTTRIFD